jgi:hypothetical protein
LQTLRLCVRLLKPGEVQTVDQFDCCRWRALASNRVAKAAPDGYQFVIGNIGTHAWSQSLRAAALLIQTGSTVSQAEG